MREFAVPDSVHSEYDDNNLTVIMNTRSGRWHTLNATATTVFEELSRNGDPELAVGKLAETFPGTPEERLREDVRQLIGMLVQRGLLVTSAPPARHPGGVLMALPPSDPDRLKVLDRIVAAFCFTIALLLLKLPLRVSIALVAKAKEHYAVTPASAEHGMKALKAARTVSRFFPGRVACMELSLTAVLVAAVGGRALDWSFGFSSDPLAFHSWVCANGKAIVHHADDPLDPDFRAVFFV